MTRAPGRGTARRVARGIALAALVVAAGALLAYGLAPKPELYGATSWSRAYLDRDGGLLRLTLAADERYRLHTPLDQIAPEMVEATLLYEDRHFDNHPGVNPAALVRAAWTTFVTRERRVGASTITMQVARLRFGLDTRDVSGKLLQILRALQLERHYSKRDILEAYFALAPYGRNIEGVGAASLVYFGKPAAQLSLPEALSLAVIPQHPTARNPGTERGRNTLAEARARLFDAWIAEHPEDAERASQFDLHFAFRAPEQLPFRAPHLTQRLEIELARERGGLIRTTLDPAMQALIEARIASYVERYAPLGVENAVALLVDRRSMAVEAYVGSADFFDDAIAGQVDGVQAPRSPGSALKPFVYALALDQGLIHPMTLMKDAPRRFGAYTPQNFDQSFLGPLPARDALARSRNVPAVELAGAIANPDLHGLLTAAGVQGLQPREHYGLAIVLGGLEIRMDELVTLYAMLANEGVLHAPRYLEDTPRDEGLALLSAEASFLTLDMLRGGAAPSETPLPGQIARPLPVAWKTGTSYGFRDAWTVGRFGDYVLAVWVGRFDGQGNPMFVGRRAAGPLFFDIARGIERERGPFEPPAPSATLNLAQVEVCASTGDLPNEYCPQTAESWFIPGVSPLKISTVYRAIPIDRQTGKRACFHEPPRTTLEVYEFWPSDLLGVFREAGIARRLPPELEGDCPLGSARSTGAPPEIRSPSEHIVYTLRSAQRDEERIPFQAITDADVQQLYWFVDDRFIGRAARGETLFWKPAVGHFDVRVVDDKGRAAATGLDVRLVN